MNGKIIAVVNQKGGVEKITTAFNLGIALANKGNKVLLVDTDPQANLTTYMGWFNIKLLYYLFLFISVDNRVIFNLLYK